MSLQLNHALLHYVVLMLRLLFVTGCCLLQREHTGRSLQLETSPGAFRPMVASAAHLQARHCQGSQETGWQARPGWQAYGNGSQEAAPYR